MGAVTILMMPFSLRLQRWSMKGADFIDVGGYSSRPGADDVPQHEELKRVIHAISLIIKRFPDILSFPLIPSEVKWLMPPFRKVRV